MTQDSTCARQVSSLSHDTRSFAPSLISEGTSPGTCKFCCTFSSINNLITVGVPSHKYKQTRAADVAPVQA